MNEYRSLKGYSFSWLKQQQSGHAAYFAATPKMQLGSAVHDILSGHYNGSVEGEQFRIARAIAIQIKASLSAIWPKLKFETSYTATAEFAGLRMPVMGRSDLAIPRMLVGDFKVTDAGSDKAFAALITYMRYEDQLWHYGELEQAKTRMFFPYSTKIRKCLTPVVVPRTERNEFWEQAILDFGKV